MNTSTHNMGSVLDMLSVGSGGSIDPSAEGIQDLMTEFQKQNTRDKCWACNSIIIRSVTESAMNHRPLMLMRKIRDAKANEIPEHIIYELKTELADILFDGLEKYIEEIVDKFK